MGRGQQAEPPAGGERRDPPAFYRDAMSLGERIPEGSSGPWRIVRRTVSEAAEETQMLRAIANGHTRFVPAGTYTELVHERDGLMMSDTPDEMRDHAEFYRQASTRGGRLLIHGLGLGMVLQGVLSLQNVEHVDVVEIDEHVINLVAPAFGADVESGRLSIHHDDCFTSTWPAGTRFSCCWHDIWPALTAENLEEMRRLHRRFTRRCDWQGSWGKELILDRQRRARRELRNERWFQLARSARAR